MENEDGKFEYKGNQIPLVIKIVWVIFFSFLTIYLASYMVPDLKNWLGN